MTMQRCFIFLTCAGLWACDSEAPTACHEDFDCPVGFTCQAGAAAEGTCAEATPGSERTFAQVQLDFATGSETYLLSIFALPTAETASNLDIASFTLAPASNGTAALRVARGTEPPPVDPTFAARSAFEAGRRAHIDAIVDDLRAGRRRIPGGGVRAPGCSLDCGTQMCWQGVCVDTAQLEFIDSSHTVACSLVDVVDAGGVKINVLVDDASAALASDALAAVQQLAETLPAELGFLGVDGWGGTLDRNGDGRITVAFTNEEAGPITTDVVGLFDANDLLAAGESDATGNEADILWSRVPGTSNSVGEITPYLAVGTLTHELVHLVSYAARVQARGSAALREAMWLDEGTAHAMEDLCGYGGSTVGMAAAALSTWSSSVFAGPSTAAADTPGQRGKAFLLLRHIYDSLSGSEKSGFFASLLAEEAVGYQHGIFQSRGADGIWQWQLATYATGRTDLDPAAHAYDYAGVTVDGTTSHEKGIDTHHDYTDARDDMVTLDGPEVGDVTDAASSTDLADGTIQVSGTLLYEVTGSGSITLRGRAPAELDLHAYAVRVK